MNKIIIIASNDLVVREICARFFTSHAFTCKCVNFDDHILTTVAKICPHALITEVFFRSRYFSPYDSETAFCHLLAIRCRLPGLPVFTICADASPEIARRSAELGMAGHFSYPLDLTHMLDAVRTSISRLVRRKQYSRFYLNEVAGPVAPLKRGRPRKYPLPGVPGIRDASGLPIVAWEDSDAKGRETKAGNM